MDVHQEINHIDDISSSLANIFQVHQVDDNAIVIERTNTTTGTNLHHLNDDCLIEIFSCKSLDRMDLCSLAETCTRFNQIARRVFPKEFGVTYNDLEDYSYRVEAEIKNHEKFCDKRDVERVLRNFGSRLSSLSIERRNEDVVHLVAKYCGAVTLTRFKIVGLHSIEALRVKLNLVFERLLRLTIFKCHLLVECFASVINFHSLTELEIAYSTGCITILKHTYPNLKRFSFRSSSIYSKENDNCDILFFIERHKQLRAVTTKIRDSVFGSKLIGTIGKSCKELEELKFFNWVSSDIPFDVCHLQKLTKLVRLEICFNYFQSYVDYMQYVTLFQELKSLEQLLLQSFYEIPLQLVDALSQLPNLRSLAVEYLPINKFPLKMLPRLGSLCLQASELCADDLFNIIRQLPNLESLDLAKAFDENDGWFVLRLKDFGKIVEIVKKRGHVLTIKCRFKFSCVESCNENRKVKLIKLYY